jgi:hypothetical protein
MKRGLNQENSLPDPEFGGESSESARATHYVVQKDTLMTYEKGLFTQAKAGIVSVLTIERKKMSTKTIYKRIALVAVAALGFGSLSVVSASAAETAAGVISSINLKAATANKNVVNVAQNIFFGATKTAPVFTAGETSSFVAVVTAYPAGGYVGVSANADSGLLSFLDAANTDTGVFGSRIEILHVAAGDASENTVTATGADGLSKFTFTPTRTGVYTITVWNDANTDDVIALTEARQTIDITVVAASGYSAALSTLHSQNGGTLTTPADVDTNKVALSAPKEITTATKASITVRLRDSANAPMVAGTGNTLTASIAGPGGFSNALAVTADAPGRTDCDLTVIPRVKTLAADDVNTFSLCSDGTSGVGTVTISVTNAEGVTTVLGTKTISFYGAVATLTATVLQGTATPGAPNGNKSVNSATQATLALTPAVVVVAKDSAGVLIPGLTVTGKSADATIVASSTTDGAVSGFTDKNGPGYYNFEVTGGAASNVGKSTTIVYSTIVSSLLTISAPAVTIALAGTPATVTMTLNAASYTPGAPVTITVTAKDAAGNPAADNTYANLFAGASVLGGAITGSTPAASVELKGGSATYAAFAPGTSGTYVITNKLGASAAAAGTTLTASVVVGSSAELSAITTLVNSLIAKINALAKLVAKIDKKVRA